MNEVSRLKEVYIVGDQRAQCPVLTRPNLPGPSVLLVARALEVLDIHLDIVRFGVKGTVELHLLKPSLADDSERPPRCLPDQARKL